MLKYWSSEVHEKHIPAWAATSRKVTTSNKIPVSPFCWRCGGFPLVLALPHKNESEFPCMSGKLKYFGLIMPISRPAVQVLVGDTNKHTIGHGCPVTLFQIRFVSISKASHSRKRHAYRRISARFFQQRDLGVSSSSTVR